MDGFKRLLAFQRRGMTSIPAVIQDEWSVLTAKAMMLKLNCRQRSLSYYDEAVLVNDLAERERLTPVGIAKLLCRKKSWVIKRLDLLSLMGITPPPGMEGRDASKLLLGKKGLAPGKKEAWEEISHTFHSSQKCAGLFTPEFQFVIGPEDFRLKKAPCRMLYDRINDPDQTCNLFDDPKYKKQVRAFQRIVLEHHRKLKTPCLEWLEEV